MSKIIWRKLEPADILQEGDARVADDEGDLNNLCYDDISYAKRSVCFIHKDCIGHRVEEYHSLALWRPVGIVLDDPVVDPNNPERKIEMEL